MNEEIPFADLVSVSFELLSTGGWALQHEAIISAPQEAVWELYTTSEGLRSFAAPMVELDFRVGGRWESSYRANARPGDPANIVNEILSYLPPRMLSIRIRQTPPDFPDPALGKRLWTVMTFEPAGGETTKASVAMLGWEEGDEQSPVFELFYRGNALVLGWLNQRFVSGPRRWM